MNRVKPPIRLLQAYAATFRWRLLPCRARGNAKRKNVAKVLRDVIKRSKCLSQPGEARKKH